MLQSSNYQTGSLETNVFQWFLMDVWLVTAGTQGGVTTLERVVPLPRANTVVVSRVNLRSRTSRRIDFGSLRQPFFSTVGSLAVLGLRFPASEARAGVTKVRQNTGRIDLVQWSNFFNSADVEVGGLLPVAHTTIRPQCPLWYLVLWYIGCAFLRMLCTTFDFGTNSACSDHPVRDKLKVRGTHSSLGRLCPFSRTTTSSSVRFVFTAVLVIVRMRKSADSWTAPSGLLAFGRCLL